MEQALTLDAVSFFKEVRDLYKETDRQFREMSKEFREMSKETDRKFQETDRKFQDTERLMKQQSLETDKQIKGLKESIGNLGNRLGDFVEEMVRPAAVRLFRERGINVHVVSRNVTAEREGEAIEIDLLVVNDGEMIVVECKSSLSIDDVNEHIERLSKVKRLFPHYREMKVMGAVAAMVMQDNVGRYAYKKGLFVLCQSGDTMVIRNDNKFKAKEW